MLSAVSSGSSRYENLQNFILRGGGRNPVAAARGFDQSGVRQPTSQPTAPIPGMQNPIPTSSARPGKATNQRIPYARLCHHFAESSNPYAKGEEIDVGDIVFVHRSSASNTVPVFGGAPNRLSRIGNLLQINGMLQNSHPENRGITTMSGRNEPFGDWRATSWVERWKNCKALAEWMPDGVIIGADTDASEGDGNLYNVCVQGPTPLRNHVAAPTDIKGKYHEQNIENGAHVLDRVFVGLIAYAVENDAGQVDYWTYEWRPMTSRQLLAINLANLDRDANARAHGRPGALTTSGPTAGKLAQLVACWSIGKIMDAALVVQKGSHATPFGGSFPGMLQLNVNIEYWPLTWLRREYNALLGKQYAVLPKDFADLFADVELFLTANDAGIRLAERAGETARAVGIDFEGCMGDDKAYIATTREFREFFENIKTKENGLTETKLNLFLNKLEAYDASETSVSDVDVRAIDRKLKQIAKVATFPRESELWLAPWQLKLLNQTWCIISSFITLVTEGDDIILPPLEDSTQSDKPPPPPGPPPDLPQSSSPASGEDIADESEEEN